MMKTLFSADAPLVLLGCGNMGGALLDGWLKSGLQADAVYIIDPALTEKANRAEMFQAFPEANIIARADDLPATIHVKAILVAIKPQMMATVLPSVKPALNSDTLLLSVAAGTTIANFETYLGSGIKMIRTMPNTPAAVGKGITGLVASSNVTDDEKHVAELLMQAAGETVWVENEALINVVTAVSGSGPAYVFHLIECLAAAAENEGLPADVAEELARHTIVGAGALLENEPLTSAGVLRERVTSPNGTTAAGLDALMGVDCGLGGLIRETVRAARKRGEELGG
ncbi:pyrroline-5-carboxylate reductase [Kordiimonas sp. SCSIO 12610]|uniref:pyrroline-5-carboxylate reductase n=1 Tax=Kordiimonas sp. SCSIO 12610 TaxID=2829597 RepID=UPI00210CAF8A|nr:pyrroline-5-carboxylate reductase [Kordiimonas sp. SCSIO 12610]UTW54968.1 pyrroline-5-carboxylate reductase [Kordiimonas sp. SCSIO 12610]